MSEKSYPRIVFPDGFDERAEYEMPLRGCLINAFVELEDGTRYAVELVDPVRLAQDLEENLKHDIPCYAEPGLIVLPTVTVAAIDNAVRFLHRQGFFKQLKPANKKE